MSFGDEFADLVKRGFIEVFVDGQGVERVRLSDLGYQFLKGSAPHDPKWRWEKLRCSCCGKEAIGVRVLRCLLRFGVGSFGELNGKHGVMESSGHAD